VQLNATLLHTCGMLLHILSFSTMTSFKNVSNAIPQPQQNYLSGISFQEVVRFTQFARQMKQEIVVELVGNISALTTPLPDRIHKFIGTALGLPDERCMRLWEAVKEVVWKDAPSNLTKEGMGIFQRRGPQTSENKNIEYVCIYLILMPSS
jgi:hypothetical protein